MAGSIAFLGLLVLQDNIPLRMAHLYFLPVENKVQWYEGILSSWTGQFEIHLFTIQGIILAFLASRDDV